MNERITLGAVQHELVFLFSLREMVGAQTSSAINVSKLRLPQNSVMRSQTREQSGHEVVYRETSGGLRGAAVLPDDLQYM